MSIINKYTILVMFISSYMLMVPNYCDAGILTSKDIELEQAMSSNLGANMLDSRSSLEIVIQVVFRHVPTKIDSIQSNNGTATHTKSKIEL